MACVRDSNADVGKEIDPPNAKTPADSPAVAPTVTLRFSGLLPDREYTVQWLDGVRLTGRVVADDGASQGSANGKEGGAGVRVEADRVTLRTAADLATSERTIELDVEVSRRVVSYSVVLSGRTSLEIDLAGAVAVQGRPLQRNDIPFELELPIDEIPQDALLRRTGSEFPCPKTDDGRERQSDRHGRFTLCRPTSAREERL
jgi:hypothetical protein